MNSMRFLAAAALVALASGGVSATDLTDYLPVYNLSHTKQLPKGTRSVMDDRTDYDDYIEQRDYDEEGRLTAVYDSGYMAGWGSIEYFDWGADGRLASSATEAHGSDVSYDHYKTSYTTDRSGRVTGYKRTHAFSAPPELNRVSLNTVQCAYTYDNDGNCVSVKLNDDGKRYDYDVLDVVPGVPSVTEIKFQYDPAGRLVKAVKTVDGREQAWQTFEYAQGRKGEYLARSVFRGPRFEGDEEGVITSEYIPFGQELPSGYLKLSNYQGFDGAGTGEPSRQLRLYESLPISYSEAGNDPRNPNIGANKGSEPLLTFIKQFESSPEFRKERSRGYFTAPSRSANAQDAIVGYGKNAAAGVTAAIDLTNELATKMFGDYSGRIDFAIDQPEYYVREWTTLADDLVTCVVKTMTTGDFDAKDTKEYVFIRTDGRWRLAGVLPR